MTDTNSAIEEMVVSLQGLELSTENRKNIMMQVDSLIKSLADSDDKAKFCEDSVTDNLLESLTKILQSGNIKEKTEVAKFIAELAKIEECRLSCVLNGVVPLIVDLLASDDLDANLQACRSLGNVCYEHDGGRMCVTGCGALKKLISLMQRIVQLPKSSEIHQLKLISTGFLLNLMNSYSIIKQHPEHLEIVKVLGVYMNECVDEDDIMIHIIFSLSCIVDEDCDQCEYVINNFIPSLIRVLNTSSSIEVLESCFEMLCSVAEKESLKMKLVEHGISEVVINIVRKFRDKCDQDLPLSLFKVAADLVVLILVGDECMNALYENGKGIVYKELLDWLSSDIMYLKVAGALSVGNFARSDQNCIQMVDEGVSSLLLRVLSTNSANEDDMNIQHSLLAALRNLAISKVNKPLLIKQGCLDILVPMITTVESYPVIFKLLGTLRMLVDGQRETTAMLTSSKDIIAKLVTWAGVFESPGIQAEATRILAWVVHNIKEESVKSAVLDAYNLAGALFPLVDMMLSPHRIMILEATFSLKHLLYGNIDEQVIEILKKSQFCQKCIPLLKNPDPNVLFNIFSIVKGLSQTDCGVLLLKDEAFVVALEEWFTNCYDSTVCPDTNLLSIIKG